MQVLPFGEMSWENFERLTLALAKRESSVEHAQRFGTAGQDQSGIDIYARLPKGEYVVYQCRKVEALGPADLKKAVGDFLEGEWADKSSEFVFCTSHSTVATGLALTIEEQAEQLRLAGITFTVWNAECLAEKLREYADLVGQYFGPGWLKAFLPEAATADLEARLASMEQTIRDSKQLEILVFDWDPEMAREKLAELKEEDFEVFRSLTERIGNPPQPDRVTNLISERPEWLVNTTTRPWGILALLAEEAGEWGPATDAWIEAANRAEGEKPAGLLVAAAVTASIAGNTDQHDDLLAQARELARDHPRVRLQDIDPSLGARERLQVLDGLESDERPLATLIACHRVLSHLLLGELDRAREFQKEAEQLQPKSATVRMTGVNVAVQQAREDTIERRRLDYPGLLHAYEEALALLGDLRERRRFQESTRLVMLAADIQTIIGEPELALKLLDSALDAERALPDTADVLGDAALRAMGFHEAIAFTDGAAASDTIDRIRAVAFLHVGTYPQRVEAVRTLDRLVEENPGAEGLLAALARLSLAVVKKEEWSEPAEVVLRKGGIGAAAISAKAFTLQREHQPSDAVTLLDPYDEGWAWYVKLQLAVDRRDQAAMKEAANRLLDGGPAQDVMVVCGNALGLAGETARARTILQSVAHDESCPVAWRADAYALLVPLLLDAGQLDAAKVAHEDWMRRRPQDTRGQALAPTIASRARRQGRGGV